MGAERAAQGLERGRRRPTELAEESKVRKGGEAEK